MAVPDTFRFRTVPEHKARRHSTKPTALNSHCKRRQYGSNRQHSNNYFKLFSGAPETVPHRRPCCRIFPGRWRTCGQPYGRALQRAFKMKPRFSTTLKSPTKVRDPGHDGAWPSRKPSNGDLIPGGPHFVASPLTFVGVITTLETRRQPRWNRNAATPRSAATFQTEAGATGLAPGVAGLAVDDRSCRARQR